MNNRLTVNSMEGSGFVSAAPRASLRGRQTDAKRAPFAPKTRRNGPFMGIFPAVLWADPGDADSVQQILKMRCLPCHGPNPQMHGFRLDRRADALRKRLGFYVAHQIGRWRLPLGLLAAFRSRRGVRYINSMPLSRRDLLNLAARAAALPGAAEFFSTWLRAAGTHAHPSSAPPEPPLLRDYKPKFFDPEDFSALQAFTEILIPTDETPGAREAHCAHYIDFVLQAAAEGAPQMQQQWRTAMAALKQAGFHDAGAEGLAALVAEMSKPERDRSAQHPAYAAYRLIKQQNTFAFYTSRAGMIETLDYRGNSYNTTFPACNHLQHHEI